MYSKCFSEFLSQLLTLGTIQLLTLAQNEPFAHEAVHLCLCLVTKLFPTQHSLEATVCKTSLLAMTFGKPVVLFFLIFTYRYLRSPWTDEC